MTLRTILAIIVRGLSRRAPGAARDLAGLAGALLVSVGVGQIYSPAGLIMGGLFLLAAALLSTRAAG